MLISSLELNVSVSIYREFIQVCCLSLNIVKIYPYRWDLWYTVYDGMDVQFIHKYSI